MRWRRLVVRERRGACVEGSVPCSQKCAPCRDLTGTPLGRGSSRPRGDSPADETARCCPKLVARPPHRGDPVIGIAHVALFLLARVGSRPWWAAALLVLVVLIGVLPRCGPVVRAFVEAPRALVEAWVGGGVWAAPNVEHSRRWRPKSAWRHILERRGVEAVVRGRPARRKVRRTRLASRSHRPARLGSWWRGRQAMPGWTRRPSRSTSAGRGSGPAPAARPPSSCPLRHRATHQLAHRAHLGPRRRRRRP